jgi:hypothetical protein
MELFTAEYRTLAGCVVEGFWAGGKAFFVYSENIEIIEFIRSLHSKMYAL